MAGGQIVNAEQTFLDRNGDPLSGGSVYFYVPGTTDLSDTWVDQGLTAVNTNPVILDQAGRALIWGQGLYRQIVLDQFGNQQWDRVTEAVASTLSIETIDGTLTVNGNTILNGSLNVSGNTSLSGSLNVVGPTTLTGLTNNGPLVQNGDLNVTGASTFGGSARFNTDIVLPNNVFIHSFLNDNTTQVEVIGVAANNDMLIGYGVTGVVGIGSGNGLYVVNGTDLNGNLTVNGTTTLNGYAYAPGGLTVNGVIPGAVNPVGTAVSFFVPGITDVRDMFAMNIFPQGFGVGYVGDANLAWASMSAGSFDITSDERRKRHVRELDVNCTNLIRLAGVHRYELEGSGRVHWGLIAQQISSATNGAMGEDGTLSLGSLVAVLWRGLQEIDQRITDLNGKVDELARLTRRNRRAEK